MPVATPVAPDPETRHARHLYTLLIDEVTCGIDRDGFVAALYKQNIGAGVHYLSIPEHDYSRWIRTYSDPSFEKLARRLESLVDRYAEPTAAHSTYSYAMRCELVFFDAAYSEREHA